MGQCKSGRIGIQYKIRYKAKGTTSYGDATGNEASGFSLAKRQHKQGQTSMQAWPGEIFRRQAKKDSAEIMPDTKQGKALPVIRHRQRDRCRFCCLLRQQNSHISMHANQWQHFLVAATSALQGCGN